MSKRSFEEQCAIVTGGANGIGRAICLALAREGAHLVVADRDMDQANKVADEIQTHKVKAVAIQTDVADESSVRDLYRRVMDQFGRLDIVVNGAGICRMIPILDIETPEWDNIIAVNLRGTFLICREAFRIMKEQRRGKIIAIASAAGKTGGAVAGAHYSASKAGVITFMKSLAVQAAPYRLNVNVVSPGPIKTALTDAWGEEANTNLKRMIPFKDYGEPEDVAEAVVFLASEKASYITGETLDVNGGLVMD